VTEWFNIVAWGNLAEICNQYLKKGQQVYIEGRLQTRHWTDEQGNKRTATEVVAREMLMLDRRQRLDGQPESEPVDSPDLGDDEEFPF
jgi:single-strand DNA-binding protein